MPKPVIRDTKPHLDEITLSKEHLKAQEEEKRDKLISEEEVNLVMASEDVLDVVERKSSLKTFLSVFVNPLKAFENFTKEGGTPLLTAMLSGIGLLSLANDVILFSKIYLAYFPPLGLQSPPITSGLLSQLSPAVYLYYFLEGIVFPALEAVYNFAVAWVVLKVMSRAGALEGDTKALFSLSFLSLAPLALTGLLSLGATSLLPESVIGLGSSATAYLPHLAKNPYYLLWECLGWAGELWSAALVGLAARITHRLPTGKNTILILTLLMAALIRMYYLFRVVRKIR